MIDDTLELLSTVNRRQVAEMEKAGAFCETALTALRKLKDATPMYGTSELYDLALDYRGEAEKRYYQNLQDSECAKTPAPERLFPKTK